MDLAMGEESAFGHRNCSEGGVPYFDDILCVSQHIYDFDFSSLDCQSSDAIVFFILPPSAETWFVQEALTKKKN